MRFNKLWIAIIFLSGAALACNLPTAAPTPFVFPTPETVQPDRASNPIHTTGTPAPSATATPASTATIPSAPNGKIVFTCQWTNDSYKNQLCLVNADGSGFEKLTDDEDTDHFFASFAPDGQSIMFTSNHTRMYEAYEMDLTTRRVMRKTFSGNNYAPAMSPDGQTFVYTHAFGPDLGMSQLWIANRDGYDTYPLTDLDGGAWDASWSPDGEYIMFASYVDGRIQLMVMRKDGSNVRQITDLEGLRGRNDWSPSGLLATYIGVTWNRNIIVFDVTGNNVVYLTEGGNNLAPSFSPDGQWIVYTSYQDHIRQHNGCEIYIMRVDGSDKRRLTNNFYCDWQPIWGP